MGSVVLATGSGVTVASFVTSCRGSPGSPCTPVRERRERGVGLNLVPVDNGRDVIGPLEQLEPVVSDLLQATLNSD